MPISERSQFPELPGLYFVMPPMGYRFEPLYVGITTTTFRERWRNHQRTPQAEANNATVYFWPCRASEAKLLELEREAIAYYRPRWNGTDVPKKRKARGARPLSGPLVLGIIAVLAVLVFW